MMDETYIYRNRMKQYFYTRSFKEVFGFSFLWSFIYAFRLLIFVGTFEFTVSMAIWI